MAMRSPRMGSRLQQCLLPSMSRMSCMLTLLLLMCLVTQNLMGPVTFVLAQEFEGFLEDMNEGEDMDVPFVVPVTTRAHQAPVSHGSDDGPPLIIRAQKEETRGSKGETDLPEFWDEDEFEGLPVVADDEKVVHSPAVKEEKLPSAESAKAPIPKVPRSPQSYLIEAACVLFFVIYGGVFWFGRKENEKIALAWATQFAGQDSIFEKNFSLLGFGDKPDDPSLMKEGQSTFKFYASGRRFCESLLGTMEFQSRHDLIAKGWNLVSPSKDEITIDVYMNEENMEPLVFALTRKKKAKDMVKDLRDLNQFATILSSPSNRKWVSDDLAVISESRELAMDLLSEGLLDQVFGEKGFENVAQYFISLHFSDQFSTEQHKKVLQFKFVIPPVSKMAEMSRLIALVPYFIDVIGRYKLSATAKSKASATRAKIEAENFRETAKSRQEAILKKKQQRETSLSSKKEEKERLRQFKKSLPKVKMTRGH